MNEVIAVDQLKQYMMRLEKLETDKIIINDDIKQIYDEAKSNGFDVRTMKQIFKMSKLDKEKLAEQDALLELYRSAINI